jgi:hypothetical protein
LSRLLLGKFLGRQLAQLVIDQRQQLAAGVGIALLDGRQDARHITHAAPTGRKTHGDNG